MCHGEKATKVTSPSVVVALAGIIPGTATLASALLSEPPVVAFTIEPSPMIIRMLSPVDG